MSAIDRCFVVLFAMAVVAVPIGAHVVGQPLGLSLCVVLSALAANYIPGAVPTVLLCGFLFQNMLVSLASPAFAGAGDTNIAHGYDSVPIQTLFVGVALGQVLQAEPPPAWSAATAPPRAGALAR